MYIMQRVFIIILAVLALVGITACGSSGLTKNDMPGQYTARQLKYPAVLIFESRTCSTCREFKPTLKSVASQYKGTVEFIHYDLDNYGDTEAQKAADQFKIFVVPTLIYVLQNGTVQHHTYGKLPEEKLKSIITQKLLKTI